MAGKCISQAINGSNSAQRSGNSRLDPHQSVERIPHSATLVRKESGRRRRADHRYGNEGGHDREQCRDTGPPTSSCWSWGHVVLHQKLK